MLNIFIFKKPLTYRLSVFKINCEFDIKWDLQCVLPILCYFHVICAYQQFHKQFVSTLRCDLNEWGGPKILSKSINGGSK